jgi:hypothetical protein
MHQGVYNAFTNQLKKFLVRLLPLYVAPFNRVPAFKNAGYCQMPLWGKQTIGACSLISLILRLIIPVLAASAFKLLSVSI